MRINGCHVWATNRSVQRLASMKRAPSDAEGSNVRIHCKQSIFDVLIQSISFVRNKRRKADQCGCDHIGNNIFTLDANIAFSAGLFYGSLAQ